MREPRLAHPRVADDGHQATRRAGRGLIECLPDHRELARSPDERRVESSRQDRRSCLDDHESIGRQGLLLSLDGERLQPFRDHGRSDQTIGGLAEQDLARLGRLLQPSGDVHRIAGDERLSRRGVGRDDLAGVHADAGLDPGPPLALDLVVQVVQRGVHLDGRPNRAEGVVLMDMRDPEDRHHRVADELLHRPPVAFDRRAHLREVALDDLAQGFGVELLAHRG